MGEIADAPPSRFNWFKLPFDQYPGAQKIQDAADRVWRAEKARREAFARAQQGGN